jgi:hypothetical protein
MAEKAENKQSRLKHQGAGFSECPAMRLSLRRGRTGLIILLIVKRDQSSRQTSEHLVNQAEFVVDGEFDARLAGLKAIGERRGR